MRGTVLGQQHAGQGGAGPRLPVAPRREARVTCPAAPAAAPHRPAGAKRRSIRRPAPPLGLLRVRAASRSPPASRPPSSSSGSVAAAAQRAPRTATVSSPVAPVPVSLWPSLRDHPHPDKSRATKTGQMMSSLQAFSKKLTAERACCTMISTSLSQ